MNNNENAKNLFTQKESNDDYYSINKEELFSYINKISNKLTNTSIKTEIKNELNNISNIFQKILKEKEIYELLLKKEENITRKLYSNLLHEKILKEILQEKIASYMKMQSDYELIKEKTGVIVCDGKIISDGRKDNEITILRTENSTLKKVIDEKEKEIEKLTIELKQYKYKNKRTLVQNFSQREFNNNFSATSRNFYKSYKIETKLLNTLNNNKTIERNSINKYFNDKENNKTIQQEKIISVNTNNKFKNNKKIITSRNNVTNSFLLSNNYSSCENILNKNKTKKKKIIKKKRVFYPMREFNSVRYINTLSNSNKENINNNKDIYNNNNIVNQKKKILPRNKKEDNKFKTNYDKFKLSIKK